MHARPMIKPALRRVWRDGHTLQLGTDPARAVVIGGLDRAAARLVDSLDGSRDRAGIHAAAARLGVPAHRVDELLALLAGSGVLEDGDTDHTVLQRLRREERDRLAPDVAAASLARSAGDGGVGVIARRRQRTVTVHGAGRVGGAVVRLLAAAGIGAIGVGDAATVRAADLSPAGLGEESLGARRHEAAARLARTQAPSVRTRSAELKARGRPDLAVLAPDPGGSPDPRVVDGLLRDAVPHLFARIRDTVGVVGPLVLPGRTSCSRCHDLHRADRDPGWPSVAAQLDGSARASGPVACDVVLATAVAAHAGLQALAYLDGDPAPPAVDGTIEVALGDGSVRRRSWRRHPSCGCTWAIHDHRSDPL